MVISRMKTEDVTGISSARIEEKDIFHAMVRTVLFRGVRTGIYRIFRRKEKRTLRGLHWSLFCCG